MSLATRELVDAMAVIDAIQPRRGGTMLINLRVGQVVDLIGPDGLEIRVEMVAKRGNWGRLRIFSPPEIKIVPP